MKLSIATSAVLAAPVPPSSRALPREPRKAPQAWAGALFAVAFLACAFSTPASAQQALLGQLGPFTGIPVPDAPEVNQGIKAYIAQANAMGGVRGQKIDFFSADDTYTADGFRKEFGLAMQKKPIALLSPVGSAALTTMLKEQLLDDQEVIIMNAIPGAESLRNPGHPKLFHIRAGDKQQIEKIVNHARTLGMTKLSVLYQDLPIGTSGWAVAETESKRVAGLDLQSVKSGLDAASLATASSAVLKQGTQGVMVFGAPRFMADGVAALRKAGVKQFIFVLSYVPANLIVKLAGVEGARGVGIAQTYPNPNGKSLPIMREFQAAMKAAHPQLLEYTPFQLEGYLSARIVVDALRRAKDRTSAASVIAALRAAGPTDLGGFRVDFSKSNVGSSFVDIGVIGGDGKLRY